MLQVNSYHKELLSTSGFFLLSGPGEHNIRSDNRELIVLLKFY